MFTLGLSLIKLMACRADIVEPEGTTSGPYASFAASAKFKSIAA